MSAAPTDPLKSVPEAPAGSVPPGSGKSTVNWLVVGVGDVALKNVLPAIQADPRSTLHGVVSRDSVKRAEHAPRGWDNLHDAVQDEAIDAVYLATPVFLHHAQALQALRAGKHVLCEKPIALSWAEACGMEQIARQEKRLLGVSYFRRYYPKLVRARELLRQGVIGEPVMATTCCSEWLPDEMDRRAWLLDPERAGSGPLYDIGSHRIDALNFLLGNPARVTAQLNNAVRSWSVEDSASVLIEYASGARALVDARWNTHATLDDFRIVGTEGVMELGPLNGPTLRYGEQEEDLPSSPNRLFPCLQAFVGAVLDGRPLECSAERVRGVARVLDNAVREWRANLQLLSAAV